jgi:hypothetical protein
MVHQPWGYALVMSAIAAPFDSRYAIGSSTPSVPEFSGETGMMRAHRP